MNDAAQFKSTHAFQAIVGACSDPGKRSRLLGKVAQGLLNNPGLSPQDLREAVQKAIDTRIIDQDEARRLFKIIMMH